MADPQGLDRRGFVKIVLTFLGTIMGAVIGIPAIGYLISPATRAQKGEAWIPLGQVEKYPPGIPTLFNFTRTSVNGWEKTVNSYGVFVLRSSDDQVRVYSNMCTHLSCRVSWKAETQEYLCPCHDGHFDIDGKVTAGPPPKPMQQFETKVEDGNLSIHFIEA